VVGAPDYLVFAHQPFPTSTFPIHLPAASKPAALICATMETYRPSRTLFRIPGVTWKMPGSGHRLHHGHTLDSVRIPGIHLLPDKVRNHLVAVTGEFIGTFLFLLLAFSGTQIANAASNGQILANPASAIIPNTGVLIYISLSFGFSLTVNAWVFFRISGGLFNPAVSLAMALIGAVPWVRAGFMIISQIVGAIAASAVVKGLFPGPLLVTTALGPDTSIAQGLFIEMFLTAELVFTIFMLAAEKHKGTFISPLGIGFSLFIAELSGVWYTGGSLNPARSFGPDVILGKFSNYHWIYWVGPALGAILAAAFYRFVKLLEYEHANPGQDVDLDTEHFREETEHLKEAIKEIKQSARQGAERSSGDDTTLPTTDNVQSTPANSAGRSQHQHTTANNTTLFQALEGGQGTTTSTPLPNDKKHDANTVPRDAYNVEDGGIPATKF